MKRLVFGKDESVTFSYNEGSEPSSDAPSIYVFSEKPTKAQVRDGSGSYVVGSEITSWSNGTAENSKEINIPAIDDPEPDSNTVTQEYYLGIEYYIQSSEQAQVVILPFLVSRPVGTLSGHELTIQDLIDVFPTLDEYITDYRLGKWVKLAIDDLSRDLKRQRNVRFDQVINQNDLKYPIALKAASLACYAEFDNPGDQFYDRSKKYEKDYFEEIDSLEIEIDSNQDGTKDKTVEKRRHFIINNAQ